MESVTNWFDTILVNHEAETLAYEINNKKKGKARKRRGDTRLSSIKASGDLEQYRRLDLSQVKNDVVNVVVAWKTLLVLNKDSGSCKVSPVDWRSPWKRSIRSFEVRHPGTYLQHTDRKKK